MTTLDRLRIEKAAADCGFERTPVLVDDGSVELRSARFPEVVVVRSEAGGFLVSASNPSLLDRSVDEAVSLAGLDTLYGLLQRASALARTMPNRVADQFQRVTRELPRTTEAERLVVQRVGQDLFRDALLDYWQGRCCVTGLAIPALLRASHIKPWAKCASDEERLDVFNGLLLAPHVDALFDGGWISFSDEGAVLVSGALPAEASSQLGVLSSWSIRNLKPAHTNYLQFHRASELRQPSAFYR